MAVGSADLHKAITNIWNSSGLDSKFNIYWPANLRNDFIVCQDCEAEPKQPFPYCVFEQDEGRTVDVMTAPGNRIFETREIPWRFIVHTHDDEDPQLPSAKVMASQLVEEILKVFGGHPGTRPKTTNYPMDYGKIHFAKYLTDVYGREPTRENYVGTIHYEFKVDVPVTIS